MAKGSVTVDEGRCKGCGLCVAYCPGQVLVLDSKTMNMKGYHPAVPRYPDVCAGCAICALVCPDVAISVKRGEGQ